MLGGSSAGTSQVSVVGVDFQNDKIVISGNNLTQIQEVRIQGNGVDQVLPIETNGDQVTTIGSISGFQLAADKVFQLIISDAYGSDTFDFTVSLDDNSVTTAKIADGAVTVAKLSTTGASNGDILQFNGGAWGFANLSGLAFQGTWDATGSTTSDTTDLTQPSCDGKTDGDYFVVSVAGTTLINGESAWGVGDWAICSNANWIKLNSQLSNLAATASVGTPFNSFLGGSIAPGISGGINNVAVGYEALNGTIGGDENVAIGVRANFTENQFYTTFVGYQSGEFIDGNFNTAMGWNSLQGAAGGALSGWNTAIGSEAMQNTTLVTYNTALGYRALESGNGATRNTALGGFAGSLVSSGDYNTLVGFEAGDTITTGSRNIMIGYQITASAATTSDELNIGNTIYGDLSTDQIGIGVVAPSEALEVNGNVLATAHLVSSDERLKKNIEPLQNNLANLKVLNGVRYSWRVDEYPEKNLPNKEEIGLIAQDVQKVYPEAVVEGKDGFLRVAYGKLIAPIIEALNELGDKTAQENKELKREISSLKAQNEQQQKDIDELKKMLKELKKP